MLVRGAAGSVAIVLLAGSAALAADSSPGDASVAPQEEVERPSGRLQALRSAPPHFPHLACAAGRLFRDHAASSRRMARHPLEAERSRHQCLDHRRRRSGDEPLRRRTPHSPGGWASRLQAEFDLQKSLALQGTRFLVTLVDRWGRDAATDAGIPALQLLNEVYGRGNILRLEQFAWDQKWFDGRIETTVGRLAFGDEFFSYPCDFINLTFCPGQAGNLVGDYIYNWPVSQWAAVAKVNFGSEGYFKAGVFNSNTAYLDTTPNPASLPAFPGESQGAIFPAEIAWTPNSTALREATRLVAGGAATPRQMSRPASMESRSWCQGCQALPVTDATDSPPCCSSNSPLRPTTQTRRTTA